MNWSGEARTEKTFFGAQLTGKAMTLASCMSLILPDQSKVASSTPTNTLNVHPYTLSIINNVNHIEVIMDVGGLTNME